ncbi:MAG: hypothetical protein JNK23_19035 [Opitutaceae bacterium]|nr:hypothetical protein [Opitutaceae bacterium]
MKLPRILAFTAASLFASVPAFAGLIGATVTGTLNFAGFGSTNYFSYTNAFVPAGYLNSSPNSPTVVISGAAQEFAFQSSASLNVADFTDTQLIISSDYFSTTTYNSWAMTFTSVAFTSLSLDASSYSPGHGFSFSGNTITITWDGASLQQGQAFRAVYNVGSASGVPDGGSTLLLLAGSLVGAIGAVRRLKLAS